MSQGDIERKKPRAEQERELLGWLRDFLSQFELAWKLLWDQRVSFFTKLVPLSLLGYLLMPFDLIPDALLGLGQVDDLVVILVGLRMFVSLCPPDVVADLQGIQLESGVDDDVAQPVQEIIDLEPEMLPADKSADDGPSA
jgi:uncharacterized membrane protein YkvA (DUF1232 family)